MGISPLTCPAPQADRLSVVAAVVDAIAEGCDTADAIADAIGMTGRQGGYYPNAAWTLGYAEPVPHTSPVQWRLTSHGEHFATLDTHGRSADLTEVIALVDEVTTFTADANGADDLALLWAKSGYSEETVGRRLQTIGAWVEFLAADPSEQRAALESASTSTRQRAPHAKQRAAAAKAAKIASGTARTAAAEPAQGAVCSSCCIVKPLVCDCPNCD